MPAPAAHSPFPADMTLRELMQRALHAYGLRPEQGTRHELMHGVLYYLERTGRLSFPANGNWTAEGVVDAMECYFPAYAWDIPNFEYRSFRNVAQKTAQENRDEENLRRLLELMIGRARMGKGKNFSARALGRAAKWKMSNYVRFAAAQGIQVIFSDPHSLYARWTVMTVNMTGGTKSLEYRAGALRGWPRGFVPFTPPDDKVLRPVFDLLRPALLMMRERFSQSFTSFGPVTGQDQINQRSRAAQDALLELTLAQIFPDDFPQRGPACAAKGATVSTHAPAG